MNNRISGWRLLVNNFGWDFIDLKCFTLYGKGTKTRSLGKKRMARITKAREKRKVNKHINEELIDYEENRYC